MNKRKAITIICLLVILFVSINVVSAVMTSDSGYQIWADVISVGGIENTASDNYNLRDTLGEGIISRSSSTNYSSRVGFREMVKNSSLTLSIDSNAIDLGSLRTTQAGSGSHTLTVETNSSNGVSVTFSGSTLTCSSCAGTNEVTGIGGTAVAALIGTSQFGFNVIYNSGTSPVASSVGSYSTASQYAFNSGDEIASSGSQINSTVFDVTYIANISGAETVGSYSTTITYTATANF